MSEKRRFNLHLPGLLKVLAEHLYSTRKVGVRELLQNAHDSCVRRKIEEADPSYRPRIDLAIEQRQRTLTIRDNGCGLTADEIATYLATIGRGYTRELRERLTLCSAHEAAEGIDARARASRQLLGAMRRHAPIVPGPPAQPRWASTKRTAPKPLGPPATGVGLGPPPRTTTLKVRLRAGATPRSQGRR